MNYKMVFLILHYLTIDDTNKCVESILERYPNEKNIEIVIVDNNSSNNTGKDLCEKYKLNNNIHIICSNENLGFANGNNLGFKYAKEKLNPDFIIMINNDTYLIQNDFCEIIIDEYNNSKFGILGPRILMNNNMISNYSDVPETIESTKRKIKNLKFRKVLNELHLYFIYTILKKIKETIKKEVKNVDTTIRKEDVVLQGCALIFSKKYIEKFDGIDNRTFLFNEEQLLYWRAKQNSLLTVYNPLLFIYHNENSSTNEISKKSQYNKRKFVIENELKSTNILLQELEGKGEKCLE